MGDFPNVVRKVSGGIVPCARPCTGIELLQLIHHDDVKEHGLFRRNPVFTHAENTKRTLIDSVSDQDSKGKLESLVANAGAMYVLAWDVTQSAPFLNALLNVVKPPQANELARVGLKAASQVDWTLSFGNGRIKKYVVSWMGLTGILKKADIMSGDHLTNIKGVVTAIYSITGALTYTGDAELVTTGEAPIECADVLTGWQYIVADDGNVFLSEIDQKEWMIAIEYETLEELMNS